MYAVRNLQLLKGRRNKCVIDKISDCLVVSTSAMPVEEYIDYILEDLQCLNNDRNCIGPESLVIGGMCVIFNRYKNLLINYCQGVVADVQASLCILVDESVGRAQLNRCLLTLELFVKILLKIDTLCKVIDSAELIDEASAHGEYLCHCVIMLMHTIIYQLESKPAQYGEPERLMRSKFMSVMSKINDGIFPFNAPFWAYAVQSKDANPFSASDVIFFPSYLVLRYFMQNKADAESIQATSKKSYVEIAINNRQYDIALILLRHCSTSWIGKHKPQIVSALAQYPSQETGAQYKQYLCILRHLGDLAPYKTISSAHDLCHKSDNPVDFPHRSIIRTPKPFGFDTKNPPDDFETESCASFAESFELESENYCNEDRDLEPQICAGDLEPYRPEDPPYTPQVPPNSPGLLDDANTTTASPKVLDNLAL